MVQPSWWPPLAPVRPHLSVLGTLRAPGRFQRGFYSARKTPKNTTNETFIAHLSAELGLLHDKAEAFCLPRETIFMPLLVSIRYSVGTSTQGLAPPAATEGSNYLRAGS